MAEKTIDDVLLSIKKKMGKDSVMMLGEAAPINDNLLSTGSLLIDKALGGGIGLGRVVELYGVESSGKSTLALHIAKQCQETGGNVAYIDVENALDVEYAKKLGVNTDKLIFSQPSSAEEALEIADMLAQSGLVRLIIVDSVAALSPKAELDGEMSDVTIGLLARLMSKAMRKLTGTLNQQNCAIVFINQIREKISTGFSPAGGDNTTTAGGRALKFFASQRIELKKTTQIKEGDIVIGQNVKIKVVKNKIAPPMKVVEVPLIFGEGFASKDEAIDLAVEYEIIEKSGAWFTNYDGERFCGKSNLRDYFDKHPEKLAELKAKVVEKFKASVVVTNGYQVDETTGEVIG